MGRGKTWPLVAAMCVAAVVYVAAWLGWAASWSWVTDVDDSTLAAAHHVGVDSGVWIGSWDALCTVFSPFVLRVVALGVAVYAFVRRRHRIGWFLIVVAVLSGLLTEGAKQLADRPRPGTAMVSASSSSFPSGHALGAMSCVLALTAVLLPYAAARWRPWWLALGIAVIVLVGVGRVALNVHHASDVVAGWALGFVWFAGWLLVLRPDAFERQVSESVRIPEGRGSAR